MRNRISTKTGILRCSLACLAVAAHLVQGCANSSPDTADLTITNARLYTEPGKPPVDAANISMSDGRIMAVYTGQPMTSERTIDAGGRVVTAGLWNSHVHFTDPEMMRDSERVMRDMLLRYGFTTVVDAGSDLRGTLAIKRRIDEGELPGPHIITASGSFVYTDGTPAYLPDGLLPEIGRPEEAGPRVAEVLDAGADAIKIFSGSFQGRGDTIHLPPDVIRAISDAAHARGSFVFSHPTDRTGITNAVRNGVDVLAHTAPQAGPLGPELVATMKANNVALVPTLKLWAFELERAGVPKAEVLAFQNIGVGQLAEYLDVDGEILFGTDAGYMSDFDTSDEFALMHAAGMTFNDILASMTTIPSRRFAPESGRVVAGAPADLVVFDGDPSRDVTAFSRVAYTVRAGRIVYQNDPR